MLRPGRYIYQLYFAAVVDHVCLMQPLKQTVKEVDGFFVVVKVHDFSFPFLWLLINTSVPHEVARRMKNGDVGGIGKVNNKSSLAG
jgi:hypothetical protein